MPKVNYHNIKTKPSDIQTEMVASLAKRAEKVRARLVEPNIDNMLKITNDGRKLALDQRMIDPMLPDDPDSKVNACVDNMYRIWEEHADTKATQLVFCDLSTPKNDGTFNVYDDMREKLIARGIPAEQVRFIHEATTDAQKKELFGKVRSGEVRVLFGSTPKMGAGTNVQDRLIAIHNLDCPWRPSDLEQRQGRIERQGNMFPEVEVYRYVTEQTFDAYLYQLVESKQKFISQIMTSKSPVRSAEDVDEVALSFAEVKMLATGDARFKEKMDLDIQVSKLRVLKQSYLSEHYDLEDRILKFYPQTIKEYEERIAGYEKKIQNNLFDLLSTDNAMSLFLKEHDVEFAVSDKHLNLIYKGKEVSLEDTNQEHIPYLRWRLGHNANRIDFCFNGFLLKDLLYAVKFQSFSEPQPQIKVYRVKGSLKNAKKIGGLRAGAKNIAILLYSILKEEKKTKGKARLTSMLRSGKELKVFTVKSGDLKKFTQEAKKYGVLYCVLTDRKNKDPNAEVDVIARAEDASKISRIVERFNLASVDTASIVTEAEKSKDAKDGQPEPDIGVQEKAEKDKLLDELMGKPVQKEENAPNPSVAKTEKSPQSEPTSEQPKKSAEGATMTKEKPSVREELRKIKESRKEQKAEINTSVLDKSGASDRAKSVNGKTEHKQPQRKKKKPKSKETR